MLFATSGTLSLAEQPVAAATSLFRQHLCRCFLPTLKIYQVDTVGRPAVLSFALCFPVNTKSGVPVWYIFQAQMSEIFMDNFQLDMLI